MKKLSLIFIFIFVVILSGALIFWKMQGNLAKNTKAEESYSEFVNKKGINVAQVDQTKPNVLSGWVSYWDESGAISSMTNNSGKIDHVLPFWYRVLKNGQIIEMEEAKNKSQVKDVAIRQSIQIMPTIINEFDPEPVSSFLDDQALQQKTIDDLVFIAASNGYRGWDIDWEELYVGDRNGFTYFVEMFAAKLHEKNMLLSVTVQAKTGTKIDNPSAEAQDWRELSKHADEIRIMAYDYHNADSEPGPITPLEEYVRTLDIAVSQIPTEKIVVSLPTYGYDWNGNKGIALQYSEAIERLKQNDSEPNRDALSLELTGEYRNGLEKHEVWFHDSESTKARIDLAKSKGINKFSFWRLGGEDEKIWSY